MLKRKLHLVTLAVELSSTLLFATIVEIFLNSCKEKSEIERVGYDYTVRFIAQFFCVDATLLCEFESGKI